MIILLVEDKPEELEKAKEIFFSQGFKVAVATTLKGAFRLIETLKGRLKAVVTDLHYPESDEVPGADKPNGLALMCYCIRANIPVVICSDINHHWCAYTKDVIETLGYYSGKQVPFIMDKKDWKRAGEELLKIIPKGE